jgi:hypothetical protein
MGPHVRYFVECLVWHSAKRASLPSARAITLGKEPIPVPGLGSLSSVMVLTLGKAPLCRVSHSAK